ncbi:MAG: lamin tail domain-containing protein [Bacteroidales bacterium]|nr:lamin tail domain-containing protein [Bacteroidales bacterium]
MVINEYCVTNVDQHADNYGEFPDWIELYNAGSSVVNLKDYGLSDNPDNPDKWKFPVNFNLPSHGYKIIWLSGRNESSLTGIHTNFKLTQTKIPAESLVLSDPTGVVLEEKVLEVTQLGHSRGRTTDGSSEWSVFTAPTFGSSNNSATPYTRYAEKPVMSVDAGFYTNSFSLTITTNELNAVIRYTTNGYEPKPTSLTVTGPITMATTRVMKAKTFSSDPQVLPSLVEFRTYFFNVSHSLPVISVAADNLTDLLNGDASLVPYGSYEYFGTDDQLTTSSYGQINKHGQDSWGNPQRSIDVVSRDECGYNSALKNKFFKTSDRTEFQRLILRASGDDNYPAKDSAIQMRDDFIMTASDLMGQNLDWRRSHRCVLYANGQFWGVYAIRERDDDADYCEYYYGQDKYNLQFCMLWGGTWSEYGGQQAIDDYHDLYYYIMHNNMASPEKFDYVASQYDYTSLADYVIINSYVVCSDWINWNVGWWRGMDSTGSHKKWGYILWDEDATFNHYINYTGYQHNCQQLHHVSRRVSRKILRVILIS